MKAKLVDWIQIITGFAIVLGLILVIWELNQGRQIAVAQQVESGFDHFANQLLTQMGEDPAGSIAKACDEPDSLTTRDMIVLSAYHTAIVNRVRRGLVISKHSEIVGERWSDWTANFGVIFSTEYGRWWWRNSIWEPEIMEAGSRWLSENPAPITCSAFFDSYRNRNT